MVDYSSTCTCCDEPAVGVIIVGPDLEMAVCAEHRERRAQAEARHQPTPTSLRG